MARSDKETLEVQNNRMQHKVKDLGEDFRMRLIKYVEDIAVSILMWVFFNPFSNKPLFLTCFQY